MDITYALRRLNELRQMDPELINQLMEIQIPVSADTYEKLSSHPSFIAGDNQTISLLGVLNGLIAGSYNITAVYAPDEVAPRFGTTLRPGVKHLGIG